MLQSAKADGRPALRVGVVGVGVMGANHARVLAELPGVSLAGVVDPDRKQAHFVGSTLSCAALASVEELLIAASMRCRLRRRPIFIATSRSPASPAASMCWWKSRSHRPSPKARRSSLPRDAPASP